MTAREQVVVGQASHRLREHLELVVHKRVLCDEAIPGEVVVVFLRSLRETEHRREPRAETLPQRVQVFRPLIALRQEAASDHVRDLLRRQAHLDREAPLNLREVSTAALVHLRRNTTQFLLRGHKDPGATGAMRRQLLGDGLQVQHQLRVVADELADLVDEEGDALVRPLTVKPRGHVLREGLGRQVHLLPIAAEGLIHLVPKAGQRPRDKRLRKDGVDATDLPGVPSFLLVGLAKTRQFSPIFQVALECTNSQILRVQAARLKVDLVEDLDHCRSALTRRLIILGVDIEEHRARGRMQAPLEVRDKCLIACDLLFEGSFDIFAGHRLASRLLTQQVGQHLQQVRLTRPKETRDPHAVRRSIDLVPRIDNPRQTAADLAGHDVFVDLGGDLRDVISLDDTVDRPEYILRVQTLHVHASHLCLSVRRRF